MARALVLGGTGHLGSAVARELLHRGWQVTVASRGHQPAAALAGLPLRRRVGDVATPGLLRQWLAGHDALFDAAAPYPLEVRPPWRRDAAVARARRHASTVLAAAADRGAPVVLLSSFATLRPEGSGDVATRAFRRLLPYFAAKRELESAALAAARGGLPVVVVNPTACLGPWDYRPRPLCFVPRLLRREIPASISHPVDVIDVRDVATGAVAALETERFGERIPLVGHRIDFDALVGWLCELGGVPPPRRLLPLTAAALAAAALEGAAAVVGRRPPWPALALALLRENAPRVPGPAQHALGVRPRPLSATLRDSVGWYRRIGYC